MIEGFEEFQARWLANRAARAEERRQREQAARDASRPRQGVAKRRKARRVVKQSRRSNR